MREFSALKKLKPLYTVLRGKAPALKKIKTCIGRSEAQNADFEKLSFEKSETSVCGFESCWSARFEKIKIAIIGGSEAQNTGFAKIEIDVRIFEARNASFEKLLMC